MYQLQNFDIEHFLTEYWQKKPCIIKQGFKDFIDPVDEHILAGLTEEDSVDSRIVSYEYQKWQVNHGPYDDINQHCIGAWSLLVQSVDHYIPQADLLMRAFDFIPHWRMDDLMVSYSNENAGVGPHLDQYDVFIIQGKGSRRWQVGLPGKYQSFRPHCDLSQIPEFTAVIDQVLTAGDIIYIPPNHPHNGIALEECLNYSVGFRAPTQQEMLSSFADFAIDNNVLAKRYSDPKLQRRTHSGEIKQQEVLAFKQFLQQTLESELFSEWLASFMSQSKVVSEEYEQEQSFTVQEITELLAQGASFIRSPGVKAVFAEQPLNGNDNFTFYIESQAFSIPAEHTNWLIDFLSAPQFSHSPENPSEKCLFFTQLLSTLVNSGYWYLE
ncbi:cupin domain-containing protein [Paraglaciecola sp. L3A3]|uniref:cupin domain-containing protein n=1 Tax=Paraglaciecola sp. L3A3 TaxID=2686358 RepID=UPI00131B1654|nr:cupin domain-containing protein [Paraglaciecola sp. L3A3]